MLKKRILASSMASVMALSSVSVVAFADETATAEYGEAVTRAELKEILATIEKDVDKGVYDEYGTKFGEIFTKAFEAAKLAVDEGDDDYVVASYQVLMSVLAKKQDVGIEELKELVDDLSSKYKKGNIINDELEDDYYYTPATWVDFVNAYEAAEIACESDNKTEICDAYFTLVDADGALKSTTQVTKTQLNQAYQAYRAIIEQKNQYESWRRGKATESVTTGRTSGTADFKDTLVTFGDLFGIIAGASTATTLGGKTVTGTWVKFPNAETTLEEAIDTAYGKFMNLKTATKTANAEIVDAYNACQDAVRVFNGWKVDDVRRGSAASFDALVRSNATTLWTLDIDKNSTPDALGDSHDAAFFGTSVANASFTIENGKIYLNNADSSPMTVYLDKNGKLQYNDSDGKFILGTTGTTKNVEASGKLDVTNMMPEFNLVTAGSTYLGYLDSKCKTSGSNGVTLTDALQAKANIDAAVAAKATDFSKNFNDSADGTPADTALTKEYNDIKNVTAKSNSAAAYSLAYRILEYALNDIIPTAPKSYKKSDVKAYVTKANALLEQAEKSATFATEASVLADELAATAEWLAAASKKDYVEYEPVTYTAVKATTIVKDQATSTDVWGAINTAYTNLEKKLAKYPYSYEEIAGTIAETAVALDEDVYGASADKVAAALEKVAYDLVTLQTEVANSNNAYDEYTYEFIPFNRVNKDGTMSEKAFVADYLALLAAVEEASKEPEAPEVVKGDLTGDGVATPEDAIMIVKAFVGEITLTDAQQAAADFNGDGVVNADDALAVVKAYVGL
ncbi:MAG: dockerin type I repeat-containing protein [[Eubacterium] saphenum]|nr:dockerin type I repeat-containing protein [[Eubacterium] saphenum]